MIYHPFFDCPISGTPVEGFQMEAWAREMDEKPWTLLSSVYIGMGTLSNNYLQLERVGVGWVGPSWVWTQLTTKENQVSHLKYSPICTRTRGFGCTQLNHVLLSWLLGWTGSVKGLSIRDPPADPVMPDSGHLVEYVRSDSPTQTWPSLTNFHCDSNTSCKLRGRAVESFTFWTGVFFG